MEINQDAGYNIKFGFIVVAERLCAIRVSSRKERRQIIIPASDTRSQVGHSQTLSDRGSRSLQFRSFGHLLHESTFARLCTTWPDVRGKQTPFLPNGHVATL